MQTVFSQEPLLASHVYTMALLGNTEIVVWLCSAFDSFCLMDGNHQLGLILQIIWKPIKKKTVTMLILWSQILLNDLIIIWANLKRYQDSLYLVLENSLSNQKYNLLWSSYQRIVTFSSTNVVQHLTSCMLSNICEYLKGEHHRHASSALPPQLNWVSNHEHNSMHFSTKI